MPDPAQQPSTSAAPPPAGVGAGMVSVNARLLLSARWLLNATMFAVSDACMLLLSLSLAGTVRHLLRGEPMLPDWATWIIVSWLALSIAFRLTPGWGLSAVEELKKLTLLLFAVFGGVASLVFLAKISGETSRLTVAVSLLFALFLVPLARRVTKTVLIRLKLWGLQVVVYGDEERVRQVCRMLRESLGTGYVPVAVFLSPMPDQVPDDLPVLDWSLDPFLFSDTAILVEPKALERLHPDLVERKLHEYRRIILVPELDHNAPSLWVTARDLGGTLGLEVSCNLQDPIARALKLTVDVFAVLVTAPLVLPLLLVITVLIWLSDFRNPFFSQVRVGRHGRTFRMWKFRTMHPDAEELLRQRLETDPAFRDRWNEGCKLREDPRVTRIGRLLRKSSLDELPQFLNVLRGEMSLIGPRPLPEYHDRQLPAPVRELRERVRPGMTGLWQVSGRSESGNDGLVRWDTYYVRNWSIWLDLVILTRTLKAVLCGNGAY